MDQRIKTVQAGLLSREVCHLHGVLHFAFTILLFNSIGQVLLTRRSMLKPLWPNYWDTSCSSHLLDSEDDIAAGNRRLMEELGIQANLQHRGSFQYFAVYEQDGQPVGSEHELCALLVGHYDGELPDDGINADEVSSYKWVDIPTTLEEIESNQDYSPWLKIALAKYVGL